MQSQQIVGVEVAAGFEGAGDLAVGGVDEEVGVRSADDGEGEDAVDAPDGVDVVDGDVGEWEGVLEVEGEGVFDKVGAAWVTVGRAAEEEGLCVVHAVAGLRVGAVQAVFAGCVEDLCDDVVAVLEQAQDHRVLYRGVHTLLRVSARALSFAANLGAVPVSSCLKKMKALRQLLVGDSMRLSQDLSCAGV